MTARSTQQPLPADIQALVNQTIESLRELMPAKAAFVSDDIKTAIFSAIDGINADMRALNLAIHGEESSSRPTLIEQTTPNLASMSSKP